MRKEKHSLQREGIANIFGEFHSELFAEENDDDKEYDQCRAEENVSTQGQKSEYNNNKILELSKHGIQAAIDRLIKRQRV